MKAYNRSHIALARQLRRNATPWERKLWHQFLRTHAMRWRRQTPLGERIIDFYCAKAALAVELDGGHHYSPPQQAADAIRTGEIETMGIMELRFSNIDVDQHFEEVCDTIDRTVKERIRQRSIEAK